MAKRNRKGGWTGTAAGSGAVRSGGGPQVEKNTSELRKFDTKYTPFQKGIRVLLFVLACVLAGSLIYQATPKNMAEYWGVDEQWDAVSKVEITVYDEEGNGNGSPQQNGAVTELTEPAELEAFYAALDGSELRRLWVDDDDSIPFTTEICIYLDGKTYPDFLAGFIDNHVYFLYMPTYPWYLEDGTPLLEYLN